MKISGALKIFLSFVIIGVPVMVLASGSISPDQISIVTDKTVKNSVKHNAKTTDVVEMNQKLYSLMILSQKKLSDKKKLVGRRQLIDSLILKNADSEIDSIVKSDSYYFAGIFYLLIDRTSLAKEMLKRSFEIRELKGEFDERAAKTAYNLAVAYRKLGDFNKMEEYDLRSINIYKKIYGESNYHLVDPYIAVISANIDLQETEKALTFSNIALSIAKNNADSIPPQSLADLYSNLGVCYSRMADFSKARIYFETSETIHEEKELINTENYINLINSLAITYDALGQKVKSVEFYQKGVNLALDFQEHTSLSLNIINSYAINLANSGNLSKAEELYTILLEKADKNKRNNPQLYFEVLNNYADFLREYTTDNSRAIEYNTKCMEFLKKNPEDLLLRNRVYVSYALSLSKAGFHTKALLCIQDLINNQYKLVTDPSIFNNPDLSSIQPDKISLKIFRAKYSILLDNYRKTKNTEDLKAVAVSSELVIALLEKMRININEEESRLLLGDKYRELYFNAIRDFDDLYKKTSDLKYLGKAFEYSEKSKVAGLLASTRELKASQFQIPSDLAQLEFRLKRDLGELNSMISEETNKESPNEELVRNLNEKVLKSTRERDSLISVFAKQYPAYYSIKYNTKVAEIGDIPHIVGRKGNYINYILSDSILYIFVANSKHNHLMSIPVDSSFFSDIKLFRSLLSMPAPYEDASASFMSFQKKGYALYKTLIDTIRPYLISDRLIISTDNLLSYIPFETLCNKTSPDTKPQYRSLHYVMEDFDISYTYSATFMAESDNSGFSFTKQSVAFAPNYSEPINIRSVLMSRQEEEGILQDLPFARQEAEFVSDVTHGMLYENASAKESVFKNVSGNFDIIHLAMHTLLNDKDPMRSTLIFSQESDTLNDNYLKTFEVYGIPLKAKMVVLSSCNTGSGFLSTGEGILSLARGFIYSGSQSVVMSMWEIEDRSGTEIVKMFYKNLIKGYSKSCALRKARIDYLKNSDQLRAHPYFWSALVVYGNNSPLYYRRYIISISAVILLTISVLVTLYLRKRKYS